MTETLLKDVVLRLDKSDFSKYSENARKAVETLKERAGRQGQFLNWIGVLGENQLKNIVRIITYY